MKNLQIFVFIPVQGVFKSVKLEWKIILGSVHL